MNLENVWREVERSSPAHPMMGEIFLPDIGAIPFPPKRLKPFFITFPFSLAAYQTLELSQTIHQPFFVLGLTGSSTGALRVWFQDAKSRRANQVTPVYSTAQLGTGANPHWLRRPYYIASETAMNVKVIDVSGAANLVTVTLQGAVVI